MVRARVKEMWDPKNDSLAELGDRAAVGLNVQPTARMTAVGGDSQASRGALMLASSHAKPIAWQALRMGDRGMPQCLNDGPLGHF